MVNIANQVNTVSITTDTVNDPVGVCYFDPIEETLTEISNLPNHFMTVKPFSQTIRKYYVVVSPGETLSYVKVRIHGSNIEDLYSIKVIMSNDSPGVSDFADIPDSNSFRVDNPTAGSFIPLWVLLSSKTPVNEVVSIDIDMEYDF